MPSHPTPDIVNDDISINDTPRTFGQRLRALRQRRGLNQAALARLVDLPQSSISSYERDARSPTLQMLEMMAVALGCRVSVLIGVDGDDELSAAMSWPDRMLELNGFVSQLPPPDQDELLTTMRVLAALKLERTRRRARPREEPPQTTY